MSWPRHNRDRETAPEEAPRRRPSDDAARIAELEAVLRAGAPRRSEPAPRATAPTPAPDADWSDTLRLVHRFGDQLRTAEGRVVELEQAYRELSERAERELALMAQRLEHAELCARDAGERRREAEEWLRRIHDAVHQRFGADMMVSIAREAAGH